MRIMRTTCFLTPEDGITGVVRECDLTDTLESAYHRVQVSGALTLADIFEMDGEPDIKDATATAMARRSANEYLENQLAISYFWNGEALRTVSEGGTLVNNRPAPITADEYQPVLEQLAKHPNYRHQSIVVVTRDGKMLKATDGKIEEIGR